jgi:hypothetical protein
MSHTTDIDLGSVVSLWRYPVKSTSQAKGQVLQYNI